MSCETKLNISDSRNLNLVTIADLCVNRTEACTAGLSGYIYTVVLPKCDSGVWDFSLCGSAPQYRIPISGIVIIRANQDKPGRNVPEQDTIQVLLAKLKQNMLEMMLITIKSGTAQR